MKRHHLGLTIVFGLSVLLTVAASRRVTPEITGVVPNPTTPSATAQTVTVSGHNLLDRPKLSVTSPGGAVVNYPENSTTNRREESFQVAVMLGQAGNYQFVVTNSDGAVSAPYPVTVRAATDAPKITDIKPAELQRSTTPQTLTVEGNQFAPGLSAIVSDPAGGVQTLGAAAIGQVTPTTFQISATFEMAGEYSLVATNPGGQSSNTFTFKVSARGWR